MATTTGMTFDRDSLARWYASRHFDIDPHVSEIYYLPMNSPEREIRLLEINREIAETTPLEPIDFGVDVGHANNHTLLVLDVTPDQWNQIQRGLIELPDGWTLDEARSLGPVQS